VLQLIGQVASGYSQHCIETGHLADVASRRLCHADVW
jgi:hypothetical protein